MIYFNNWFDVVTPVDDEQEIDEELSRESFSSNPTSLCEEDEEDDTVNSEAGESIFHCRSFD